jgi:hypothetical protein
MNAKRTCKDCGAKKPIEDFPGRTGGYRLYRCKACHKIFRRRYNTLNRARPQLKNEIIAGPLVEWLQDLVKQLGGPGMVAAKVGLNERALWRLLHGQQFVHEALADRVFCAAGQPQLLYILYGDVYDARDAA